MTKSYVWITFTNLVVCLNVATFDLKCPDRSQWRKRAETFCKPNHSMYHCLYDKNAKIMVEKCTESEDLPPGFKSIYSGNKDAATCSSDRFSPFISWSNCGYECYFRKSSCAEEGQILFNTGSSRRDTACRCDYKRGYTFATEPADECFCNLSKEDCTCYFQNRYTLSAVCLGKYNVSGNVQIPETSDTALKINYTQFGKHIIARQNLDVLRLPLFFVLLIIAICLAGFLIMYKCYGNVRENEQQPKLGYQTSIKNHEFTKIYPSTFPSSSLKINQNPD